MEYKLNIKEMVKDKTVKFQFYRNKELWYITEDGFEFPVPISDTGNGSFNSEDKAIRYMRWIRKHLEMIEVERKTQDFLAELDATPDVKLSDSKVMREIASRTQDDIRGGVLKTPSKSRMFRKIK